MTGKNRLIEFKLVARKRITNKTFLPFHKPSLKEKLLRPEFLILVHTDVKSIERAIT